MTDPDDATRAQQEAANPEVSAWLSANAGSGKTRVLTDRVARLLLAGADPGRILCLTYTKAAAGEMQNRLFGGLGKWAMLDDASLAGELRSLGVTTDVDLGFARTLFAAAIDTPGGLKIQTIHSFCSTLLRRFPLEAGVSPQFVEMDDTADRKLVADICEELADGPDRDVIDGVAAHVGGSDFEKLAKAVVGNAAAFRNPPNEAELRRALGVAADDGPGPIFADTCPPGTAEEVAAVLDALDAGGANDVKFATALRAVDFQGDPAEVLRCLEVACLTGTGTRYKNRPTKAVCAALADRYGPLDALMDRVVDARRRRVALAAAARSLALHRFAARLLPAYEAAKAQRGWLSFDDLIERARRLLNRDGVAQWVLYQLDGGIDHILVDEAQDTSPGQWEVIERLSEEMTAGMGARNRRRSFFVVGDKKQSIYSFQGADAGSFDRMHDLFDRRLAETDPLLDSTLRFSFRSSPAVLRAVDATLGVSAEALGETYEEHVAHKADMPGRVDLWPLVPKPDKSDPVPWETPLDRPAPNHHHIELASRIADSVRDMLESGTRVPDRDGESRPMTAGDVLILVQGRTGAVSLFREVIRALKAADLPVAGADRIKLKDSLAVKDVVALLSFLALPEDSLSLAAALRSPLFGWSEQALFDLAHKRSTPLLWEALRRAADRHPETVAILRDLRDAADFLRPYDLIERILLTHGGRDRLIARLGAEAEDSIDELLNLALGFERLSVPSLTGFIAWMEAEDTEIKRELEAAGGRIRVMTVHGAKGLESPVVILPETTRGASGNRDAVLVDDAGRAFWKPPKDDCPQHLHDILDAQAMADARERDRLLYVAMTRAESWLIVCGAGDAKDGCWYDRVSKGFGALPASRLDTPTGPGLRLSHGDWPAPGPAFSGSEPAPPTVPDWVRATVRPPVHPESVLSPSDLGGEKALPGALADADPDAALRRGRQVHLLLEHLPAYPFAEWPETAEALLAFGEDWAPPAEARRLLDEAARVLDAPDLAHVFAPGTLAEVALTAALPTLGGRIVHGAIDRLIVGDDRATAIDFKTNRVVPPRPEDTPEGLLRQLGAYAEALALIYPGHRIDTAILWTATADLMPIPHDMVMEALRRAATS